jgi:basic amino acid/polyamine antiporter, APA family
MTESPALNRSINLPMLVFYGVGTMVGGGFYALLGKVAGEAGFAAPLAFAASGALALLSAFSFAELSSRFPVSAGESQYAFEGFGNVSLSTVVGWLVILTGIVSASTLAVATIGFLDDMVHIPNRISIAALVLAMGFVASWGIGESVLLVAFITVIEVGALFVVFFLGWDSFATLPSEWPRLVPEATGTAWLGVFGGAFLAFYAFVGFEDMVNMAEEVKDVRRTLPIAILVSIVATTLLYVVVSTTAVLMVAPSALVEAQTPIAVLVEGHGWYSTTGIGIVSLLTGLNGALVQIIMASRVAYGMAQQDRAPKWFGIIHPKRKTPVRGTAAMTGVILALAVFFPLTTLAEVTSTIILVVFAIVNLALWRIKGKDDADKHDGFTLPRWLPLAGFAACTSVLLFQFAQIASEALR